MRKYLGNIVAVAIAAALSMVVAVPAIAHAVIAVASPTADQTLAPGKVPIRLEFNERIDKARSRLQLTTAAGSTVDVGIETAGDPNIVTAATGELPAGAYVLRWQVLAVDGHITRGEIPFTLGS